MKYSITIATIIFLFLVEKAGAQVGYQKDSLQIKVYTEIDYSNRQVKAIRVKKVFCDYCAKYQKEQIANEAYNRTYFARYDKNIRQERGRYRHALYIRIAKKDFARMREENLQHEQDSVLEIKEQKN